LWKAPAGKVRQGAHSLARTRVPRGAIAVHAESLTSARDFNDPDRVAPDVRSSERLYSTYLGWLRKLTAAVHGGDSGALREMELELGTLEGPEHRALVMAVHDVAGGLPRRAKAHFVRALLAAENPESR